MFRNLFGCAAGRQVRTGPPKLAAAAAKPLRFCSDGQTWRVGGLAMDRTRLRSARSRQRAVHVTAHVHDGERRQQCGVSRVCPAASRILVCRRSRSPPDRFRGRHPAWRLSLGRVDIAADGVLWEDVTGRECYADCSQRSVRDSG